MGFNVSLDIDGVAIVIAGITGVIWGMRRVWHFFDWLARMLPAKLMFVAFGIAFALCALLQMRGLDPSYPIPELGQLFQWATLVWFGVALFACTLAALVTVVDGAYKYTNRTRYIFVDHFDPDDSRWR